MNIRTTTITHISKHALLCAMLLVAYSAINIQGAYAQQPLLDRNDGATKWWNSKPLNGGACAAGAGGGTVAGFSPDPAALQIYNETIKPLADEYAELYQQAAEEEGIVDWQLLPGIHYLESGMSKTNPSSNLGYRGIFQINNDSLSAQGVADINSGAWTPGIDLTNEQFVEQAREAVEHLKGKAEAPTVNVDITKALTVEDAAKLLVAYKSGQGSTWIISDDNVGHAYTWAGYDQTPEHVLPMTWGAGSAPEVTDESGVRELPGALVIWALAKQGAVSGGANCGSKTGTFTPIEGTHDELVERLLGNEKTEANPDGKLTFVDIDDGATTPEMKRDDIRNLLTDNMLKMMIAIVEQSGVEIGVNVLVTGHDTGSLHELGRGVDINYFGHGDACTAHGDRVERCNSPESATLYNFLYDNREGLMLRQLISQDPPDGKQCIGDDELVDCYAFYGDETMSVHFHHIHVGVME